MSQQVREMLDAVAELERAMKRAAEGILPYHHPGRNRDVARAARKLSIAAAIAGNWEVQWAGKRKPAK